MVKRILILASIAAGLLLFGACGHRSEVRHSDYGYCERTGRHMHNNHVFIGDFHDESLCEWEKYQ